MKHASRCMMLASRRRASRTKNRHRSRQTDDFGIVHEKIGDIAVKLAEDIPFAALEQHLLNPDGWQALAETLLGEPSARVGYLVKASLLKAWWQDALSEQPPTKASAPTAKSVPVAGESPITRPAAATLSAKYAKEQEEQGLDEPGALARP